MFSDTSLKMIVLSKRLLHVDNSGLYLLSSHRKNFYSWPKLLRTWTQERSGHLQQPPWSYNWYTIDHIRKQRLHCLVDDCEQESHYLCHQTWCPLLPQISIISQWIKFLFLHSTHPTKGLRPGGRLWFPPFWFWRFLYQKQGVSSDQLFHRGAKIESPTRLVLKAPQWDFVWSLEIRWLKKTC